MVENEFLPMNASISRVYIIGAGASVPYGLPTLKTLTWDLAGTLSGEDKAVFLAAVFESFDAVPGDPCPDFEELLSRLDPSGLSYLAETGLAGPGTLRRRALEVALSGLRHLIRERCLSQADAEGPYDRLVATLDEHAALVSFNWDVLLERAFIRAARAFAYLPSPSSGTATLLVKPHGSINWFALLDRELLLISSDGNVAVVGDDLSHYMLYLKDPLGLPDVGSSSPFVKFALASVPAIVPPGPLRLLSVGGAPADDFVEGGHTRMMTTVWSTFKNLLDCATELVVVGYSLPGTDGASIELLKHFARREGPRRRIVLVEKNRNVAKRYEAILGTDVKVACARFEEFDPKVL